MIKNLGQRSGEPNRPHLTLHASHLTPMNQIDQINEMNQTNQIDQINQIDQFNAKCKDTTPISVNRTFVG